ncbi:uncharacterized protein K452DRAFT_286009 [Aplosporella prunicola CBS 121167]|uniref:Uncharacterized protein n=1 Tax=Aplosporella prunicola CBS 121167 TaxID=1176127 RepID=A0A6A6BK19_9PEZI|nr:uncharacterized protein K452DRAFT_286009 [Aplosporella prunicola CBS 121167]KAF2143167.1 hypothetical protein K452DRAFT_286009 [Aplosporella prunicola CBS 121167]
MDPPSFEPRLIRYYNPVRQFGSVFKRDPLGIYPRFHIKEKVVYLNDSDMGDASWFQVASRSKEGRSFSYNLCEEDGEIVAKNVEARLCSFEVPR